MSSSPASSSPATRRRPATRRLPPRRSPVLLVTGLLMIAAVETAIIIVLFQLFTLTRGGQLVETIALASNTLGAARIGHPINAILDAISIVAVAIAMAVISFIALIRKRFALAVTTVVLIGGANLSAQLLKNYLIRPNLGIDEARAAAGNSFPSGHTAIAASVVVAFMMVLPPRLRGIGAVVGSLYAAIVGIATLSAGWHRPSDAVASFLLVGVWAALAGVLLRFLRRRGETVVEAESHKTSGITLCVFGLIMLAFAGIGLWETHMFADPDGILSRTDREIAYAGSAAGIVAASCLMMAVILLTVHRVVPRRPA